MPATLRRVAGRSTNMPQLRRIVWSPLFAVPGQTNHWAPLIGVWQPYAVSFCNSSSFLCLNEASGYLASLKYNVIM